MFKKINEAIELSCGLKRELFNLSAEEIEIVLCPPFTALSEVDEVIYGSNLKLGGQDVHWEGEGAFTGEVSSLMLKDAGCEFVIIGHSERREYFKETNLSVNKKIKAALKYALIPILCVGETLKEREGNQTFTVVEEQLFQCLEGIEQDQCSKLVIAYEPVWAIGTGKTATAKIAQEVHNFIRSLLVKLYGRECAENLRIQYGGSVKPENITDLMRQPDIDGALVGGASLDLVSFVDIVKKASEVKK